MNKTNVIKTIQEVAGEHDFKFTQEDINELLKIFEESYVKLAEELELGESVHVGCVKLSKKKMAKRQGTSKLGDKEVVWETPEKVKIVLSTKKSFEKEHEVEI